MIICKRPVPLDDQQQQQQQQQQQGEEEGEEILTHRRVNQSKVVQEVPADQKIIFSI